MAHTQGAFGSRSAVVAGQYQRTFQHLETGIAAEGGLAVEGVTYWWKRKRPTGQGRRKRNDNDSTSRGSDDSDNPSSGGLRRIPDNRRDLRSRQRDREGSQEGSDPGLETARQGKSTEIKKKRKNRDIEKEKMKWNGSLS
jgi:hypothetical protein